MGFGAQPVAQVAKELNMGDLSIYTAKVIDENGDEGYYDENAKEENLSWGLKYNEFIAPMVGAIQALNDEISKKDEIINEQNKKIDELTVRLEKLEDMIYKNGLLS